MKQLVVVLIDVEVVGPAVHGELMCVERGSSYPLRVV